MASALDEDTQRALAEGRETAGAVLRSVQKDLQKVFVVFLVGFLGTFYALRLYVWDTLKAITEARMEAALRENLQIIAQTPFDVILLQAKIGLVAGLLLATPPLLYFARDGLRERGLWPQSPVAVWKLATITLLSAVLFAVGTAYGYLVFFPFMFEFLAGNAAAAGFNPHWSIVMWAQFIFLLSVSFGLAAQMPLAVTGLSYAGIVQYETFREKWRYAVVLIFVFGALFSPPDPFTQIMWALPLLALYGFSLYLAKVVVTAKRGSERVDPARTVRERWNLLAGTVVAGVGAALLFYRAGGVALANDALATAGSSYRVLPAGELFGFSPGVEVAVVGVALGVLAAVLVLMALLYREIVATAGPGGPTGDPTAIDLTELDAEGVRAAPEEAFAALSEEEATAHAAAAMEEDDPAKARAILDRHDEVTGTDGNAAGDDDGGPAAANVHDPGGSVDAAEAADAADAGGDDLGDRASRAGGTFLSELTEGERDEDDIGGYYRDITFVLDSLTSRAFRIVGVFLVVLAGTFLWLYKGGIGRVRRDFVSRLPAQVVGEEARNFGVIALHPVEALIFEVKFATLVGAVAALPVAAYYAWPALRERGFVKGRRQVIFGWVGALLVGLAGGFVLGYSYVAPAVISWLVAGALRADMVISYRISDFFWLVFYTTVGIGILVDIPVFLVLLNTAGVSYRAMRDRWREVTVGVMTFAALFTPADVITMFLVTVPLMAAYAVGLGVLWVLTLGGRRDLRMAWTDRGDSDAESEA